MSQEEFRLSVGETCPAFELKDQNGQSFSSSSLKGKKTVLYFYPAAGSPGCSKEAADFQAHLSKFTDLGYQVIGISPDEVAKLKDFEDSQELTFTLLSDPDLVAHKSYGAFGEKSLYGRLYRGVLRSTIVIDENLKITEVLYNVRATGHISMLLKKLS